MTWSAGRVVCALVLALGACTAEHVAPGPDGGTDAFDAPIFGDLEADYCAPLARFVCAHAMRCGCGISDLEACLRNQTADCVRNPPTAAYGTRPILSRVRECFALLAVQDTCDPFDAYARNCDQDSLFGSPSSSRPECREYEPCDAGHGICLRGLCQTLPATGEACLDYSLCADGAYCVSRPDLTHATCVALVPVGEVCRNLPPCVDGARCVSIGTEHRCVVSVAEGGACASEAECLAGLACAAGRCVRPVEPCGTIGCGRAAQCFEVRTCQTPVALGEPCNGYGTCDAALWCVGGACAPRPALGDACYGGSGPPCAPGSTCVIPDRIPGTCRALGGRGAACDIALAPCADELACVGAVCTDLPTLGSACSDDDRCASGAYCGADGICTAHDAEGAQCTPDVASCDAGLECRYVTPFAAMCVRIPAIGEVCVPNYDACDCLADVSGVPVCQVARALGDVCSSATTCPAGLVCRASGATTCIAAICPNHSF